MQEKLQEMTIGRADKRGTPLNAQASRCRVHVLGLFAEPIWASGYCAESTAGHMTAVAPLGGDWGAPVTAAIGAMQPPSCAAMHLNTVSVALRESFDTDSRPDEQKSLGDAAVTKPIGIPVSVSVFPRDINRSPRRWAEPFLRNIIHWNEVAQGGHFGAFEQPELFVQGLRACFSSIR